MPLAAVLLAAAAPVLGCDDRITGAVIRHADGREVEERFDIDRRQDNLFGPLALTGLKGVTPQSWDANVARDQWLKSPLVLRPSARVTLVIPRAQRSWMRFRHHPGHHRVTYASCRRGHRASGPSGNTAWSFGFEFDYAEAPQHGRCARIIVRVHGRPQPLRRRLAPNAGPC